MTSHHVIRCYNSRHRTCIYKTLLTSLIHDEPTYYSQAWLLLAAPSICILLTPYHPLLDALWGFSSLSSNKTLGVPPNHHQNLLLTVLLIFMLALIHQTLPPLLSKTTIDKCSATYWFINQIWYWLVPNKLRVSCLYIKRHVVKSCNLYSAGFLYVWCIFQDNKLV